MDWIVLDWNYDRSGAWSLGRLLCLKTGVNAKLSVVSITSNFCDLIWICSILTTCVILSRFKFIILDVGEIPLVVSSFLQSTPLSPSSSF